MTSYAYNVNYLCHYATDEELEWMTQYGREIKEDNRIHNVVMLGAGPGVLLLALKEYNRDLKATVIDHVRCDYVNAYLRDMQASDNVLFVVDDSIKTGRNWIGGSIDLLIVDTSHTEQTTREEIQAWIYHVRESGTVFFHDYDAKGTWFEDQDQYPGVKMACDDLMPKYGWDQVGRVGTAAIYRRNHHAANKV